MLAKEDRLTSIRRRNLPIPLVEVEAREDLIEALFVLRPTRTDGFGGERPVDWPEILPFAQATGRLSGPWDAETLFAMACGYAEGKRLGTNPLGRQPMDVLDVNSDGR